ncbi:MAG: hypothetical protein M3Y37_05720 [Chloroflexota bacterium]|jgi:hypothetical protein|nr:hypothetical protein [Chloroflexota bacterium]
MATSRIGRSVSRRAALTGVGAVGVGAALGTRSTRAAQAMSTADHPLMGMWLAMANPARRGQDPQFPAPSLFAADGTVILGFVPAEIGMEGEIQYTGSPMGVWEPYDEQTGHFTVVQVLADKTGTLAGTVTIDGHPKVSEDGTSFIDDGSLVTVTIRDPAGAVVTVIPPNTDGPPVTAIKMRVGNPGFPGEEDATPVP